MIKGATGWLAGVAVAGALGLTGCAIIAGLDNTYEQGSGGGGAASSAGAGGSGGGGGVGGVTSCTDNSECNDLVACSIDTCDTAAGKCVSTPAPDGPVPGIEDVSADCVNRACQAGAEVVVPDNTEVPDDGNPCTIEACMAGSPQTSFAPADTPCGAGLVCNGMGSCVGCNNPAECPSAPVCQIATCNQGTCGVENLSQGNPCATGTCNGMGSCIECVDDNDCAGPSEVCSNADCVLSCPDGSTNGDETDVDCGGGACPKCDVGQMCDTGVDCSTGKCTGGVCTMPVCNDNVKNGTETDVDCGGPTCPKCPAGATCMAGTDCQSVVCTGGTCKAPACNDMVKNGTESDVDCGGVCPPCSIGAMCMLNSDCMSNKCTGGTCKP